MNPSRELPMPNVTRISSLNQAQATLLHCWTKLSKFNAEQTPTQSFAWSPTSVSNERENFQQWLDRWELAFTAFLTDAMPSLTNEDITLSRVLKSNHLGCTILASPSHPYDPETLNNDCRAIIELSGAVLRSRNAVDSPVEAKVQHDLFIFVTTLDVKEPLQIVASRCKDESLQTRADELLSRYCLH